jgi:hypothetical protein
MQPRSPAAPQPRSPAAPQPWRPSDPMLAEFMRRARAQLTPEEAAALDRAAWRQAVAEFLAERKGGPAPEQLSGGNK